MAGKGAVYVMPCVYFRVHADRNPLASGCFAMSGKVACYWRELKCQFSSLGCEPDDKLVDDLLAAILFDREVYCPDPFSMMAVARLLHDWGWDWALVTVPGASCGWVPRQVRGMAPRVLKVKTVDGQPRYFDGRCVAANHCTWALNACALIVICFILTRPDQWRARAMPLWGIG